MRSRPASLTLPALPLALLALLAAAGPIQAHRLEAEYRILPGGQVRIESWFDLTGDSPKGATVEVFGADDRLLTKGQLDGKGLFIFSVSRAEALRVVVSAGAGHRKELRIPAAALSQNSAFTCAACLAPGPLPFLPAALLSQGTSAGQESPPAAPGPGRSSEPSPTSPPPGADRSSRVAVQDVLAGVGFLLAAAAFLLSVRNARQLRALTQRPRENG